MNDADTKWRRLLRKADLPAPTSDVFDSAWVTRVAAQAMEGREAPEWELRFAWRALGVAALVALISVGANVSSWNQVVEAEAAAIELIPASVDTLDLS